jgi:hypothetical protein
MEDCKITQKRNKFIARYIDETEYGYFENQTYIKHENYYSERWIQYDAQKRHFRTIKSIGMNKFKIHDNDKILIV